MSLKNYIKNIFKNIQWIPLLKAFGVALGSTFLLLLIVHFCRKYCGLEPVHFILFAVIMVYILALYDIFKK